MSFKQGSNVLLVTQKSKHKDVILTNDRYDTFLEEDEQHSEALQAPRQPRLPVSATQMIFATL